MLQDRVVQHPGGGVRPGPLRGEGVDARKCADNWVLQSICQCLRRPVCAADEIHYVACSLKPEKIRENKQVGIINKVGELKILFNICTYCLGEETRSR